MKKTTLLTTAALCSIASASASAYNWTTSPGGAAGTSWNGASFNGQTYGPGDDLTIDTLAQTGINTITTSGTITTPNSLTVSAAGSVATTGVGTAGTGAIALSGSAIGGTLNKTGSADLVLNSANTFGAVSISAGKIFLNNQAGLGTTGTLTVNAGTATKASFTGTSYTSTTGSSYNTSQFFFDTTAQTASMTIQKAIDFGSPGAATTYAFAMKGGSSFVNNLSGNITGGANVNLWFDQTSSDNLGLWELSGNNSGFVGNIRLNRGRIQFDTVASVGGGTVFVQTNNDSTLGSLVFNFSGGETTSTLSNAITVRSGSGSPNSVSINTVANTVTLSGVFTATPNGTTSFYKLGTGGLILTNTANVVTDQTIVVSDGKLGIAGAGVLNSGGVFAGAITLTAATSIFDSSTSANQTISGIISGQGKVTKSGTGSLTLSASNSYAGGTVISGGPVSTGTGGTSGVTGSVIVTNGGALGSGTVSLVGSDTAFLAFNFGTGTGVIANKLDLGGASGRINLTGFGAISDTPNSSKINLTGIIQGTTSGTLTFDGSTGGAGEVFRLSGTNTFTATGGIRVIRGVLAITSDAALGAASNTLYLNQGNTNASLRFDAANIDVQHAVSLETTTNFDVFGDNDGDGTTDTGNAGKISGVISGSAALGIRGAGGSLTLTGTNTMTSAVTLNSGTLITGNTKALGNGAIAVTAGTLQIGNATVNTVVLGAGATLAISDGATLKLGAFNLASLDATAGTNGIITLSGGGTFTFNSAGKVDLGGVLNGLTLGSHTYNLITGGTGTDATLANIIGFDSTVSLVSLSNGVLTFTAVPEPSAYGLIGAGAFAAAAFVRRRRRSR